MRPEVGWHVERDEESLDAEDDQRRSVVFNRFGVATVVG